MRHFRRRQPLTQSLVNLLNYRLIKDCVPLRDEKRLQDGRARRLLQSDNQGLTDRVLFENDPLDLLRINVDAADDFDFIRAPVIGDPSFAVNAHHIPGVEPILLL
ncbi:hypothetical protein MSIMFB_02732 [Mycobacterium simulans]|uniref:Uncharacterized protein n=1 Tax=Mycobacterium simulans TaxID=627089 RepID=A0A7Z7IKI1_9MYCO|nr:hypothetical protein MSIMFB_02732 [Mycobacterium simulans]